jgi:rRNA maturation endonuclease Nob1
MKNVRNISHRTYRKLMYVLIVVGITVAGIPLLISNLLFIQKILLIIGILLAVLGVTIGLVFLRCPYCGNRLNIRGFSPDFCPHCGEKLD